MSIKKATKLIRQIRTKINKLYDVMNKDLKKKKEKRDFKEKNRYLPDFVEWYTTKKLKLHLASSGEEGYDATEKKDGTGKKYEIKYAQRRKDNEFTCSLDNAKKDYDYLVAVILDEENNIPTEIYVIPRRYFINNKKYFKNYHRGSFRLKTFMENEKNNFTKKNKMIYLWKKCRP